MDRITREHRSWNMSRIRGQHTKPEIAIRSILHRRGYRFRLHRSDLPGKPDIVLAKYKTVVLVHGCFWHRHATCKYAYSPKSRQAFWNNKFRANVARDLKQIAALKRLGWRVVIVWECETRNPDQIARKLVAAIPRLPYHNAKIPRKVKSAIARRAATKQGQPQVH